MKRSMQDFVEGSCGQNTLGPLQQSVIVGRLDLMERLVRQLAEAFGQQSDQDLGLALLHALLNEAFCESSHFVCLSRIPLSVDDSLIFVEVGIDVDEVQVLEALSGCAGQRV
jgi:hypothetical protein